VGSPSRARGGAGAVRFALANLTEGKRQGWCAMNAHPTGLGSVAGEGGANPDLRRDRVVRVNTHPTGGVALAPPCTGKGARDMFGQRIFCPVFAQSFMNCSSPLSVRTWPAMALITFGGAVITSAPIRAHCEAWFRVRTEAARIWVSKA